MNAYVSITILSNVLRPSAFFATQKQMWAFYAVEFLKNVKLSCLRTKFGRSNKISHTIISTKIQVE